MKFIKVYSPKEKSDLFINVSHIIYMKTEPMFHKTMVYTTKGTFAVNETIEEILEMTH